MVMLLKDLAAQAQTMQEKCGDADVLVMIQGEKAGEFLAPMFLEGGKISDGGPLVAIMMWYDPEMVA